jgi:hypothetical protein
MQRDLAAGIDGGIAGLVATAAMSALMMAARRAGLLGRQPPERLTERALDAVGMHRRREETQDVLAAALHFGFGASMGTVFGPLRRRLRLPLDAGLQGVIFGTLVWAVSYKGWLPALGIMPPPERDRPFRPQVMVLAHWIYGWTLGRCVDAAADLRGAGAISGEVTGTDQRPAAGPLPIWGGRGRHGAADHADAS